PSCPANNRVGEFDSHYPPPNTTTNTTTGPLLLRPPRGEATVAPRDSSVGTERSRREVLVVIRHRRGGAVAVAAASVALAFASIELGLGLARAQDDAKVPADFKC